MANEPITREEILLNAVATGEAANLEPITREEMFLAKLGGADVKIPAPITRKEQFLQKAIENGGNTGGGSGGDNFPIGDGNTHIWINLTECRTSPFLCIGVNGTVTVDWGDGSEPDVLTGESLTGRIWSPMHNYSKAGDYIITLAVDGELSIFGNSYGTFLLRGSNTSSTKNQDSAYLNAIRKVECGTKGVIVGERAFSECRSLTQVILPESMSSVANATFYECRSIGRIFFPSNISSIGISVFYSCNSVRYYDFTNNTSVPTLGSSSDFSNVASDREILVPSALVDDWKAATNWSAFADYIVGV